MWSSKRLCVMLSSVLMGVLPAAQAVSPVQVDVRGTALFPYYEAPEFLESQVKFHFQPVSQRLGERLRGLSSQMNAYCEGSGRLEDLQPSLDEAYLEWVRLTTVVEGPVLEGSLVRVLNFQPFRLKTLQQALQAYEKNPETFSSFGGSARGFPALYYLIQQRGTPLNAAECKYALAVVEDAQLRVKGLDWQSGTMNVQLHFNQLLGAVQHLTWDSIEKPKLKKQDQHLDSASHLTKNTGVHDASSSMAFAAVQAQWAVLRDLLSPKVLTTVPDPDQQSIALDVFLRGLGHVVVAKTLQDHVRLVDQNMQRKDVLKEGNPQPLMKSLKALTEVLERDVAPALKVSVMFSSSDGD